MRTVRVELGSRGYDILIGRGALSASAGRIAALEGEGTAALVADETVLARHAPAVEAAFPDTAVIAVPGGEASKSFASYERVSEALLAAGVGRDGLIVALGGGVIGDLAGFCAATLRRGCHFVQVPTTLLSQVDSSVGGKTAINTRAGKNLVGAFHQPRLVVIDTGFLDSLPERELRAGYAEILKVAFLGDADFAAALEKDGPAVLALEEEPLGRAIETACAAKARIVAADEREGGVRALLNLGHTFGHAVEAAYGYDGRVLHGEAVALGCAIAFRHAVREGRCPAADARRAEALIAAAGLPVRFSDLPERGLRAEGLLAAMKQDKKVEGGRLTLILPNRLGDADIVKDVSEDTVLRTLQEELLS